MSSQADHARHVAAADRVVQAWDEDRKRYALAAHAMQTGVALEIAREPEKVGTPEDLRIGLNSAFSDASAIATLLIEKGVFTLDEYAKAVADAMEIEQARLEAKLSYLTGKDVKLV